MRHRLPHPGELAEGETEEWRGHPTGPGPKEAWREEARPAHPEPAAERQPLAPEVLLWRAWERAREWESGIGRGGSIYRWPLWRNRPQAGSGKAIQRLLLLESLEKESTVSAEQVEIETKGTFTTGRQPPQSLPQQHRGSPEVAPFAMQMGHGDLEDALEHRAIGLEGFVPERLEAIVAGVPVAQIELLHRLP